VYDLRFADANLIAVAYCASALDVVRCIEFARARDISPIPRCGGHSYGGYSTGAGLVVDVTMMDHTTFDPVTHRAVVGAGTLLVDLYAACADAGRVIPGGSCPTVGIAGLTLGGGVGVLARSYGLTCDNLQSVEIVTADGTVRDCDAANDADLFWACQGGGGGNFGIVTSFTFETHALPSLSLFTLDWPWSAAGIALASWQQWMRSAPDALWSNFQLIYQGTAGAPFARTSGVFVGEVDALQTRLASLIDAAGPPSGRSVSASSYAEAMLIEAGCGDFDVAQCHLKGTNPAGQLERASFTAKSAYVHEPMPSSGIAAATDAIDHLVRRSASVGAALVFDAYGGAINRVASDATAFVHRDALYGIQMTMAFSPDATSSTIDGESAWLAATSAALSPYCDGEAYQNYLDPTLTDWQAAYYGSNFARLCAVKRRYDPDDLFHFAQSIPLRS
jgi:FAD/FMN-containing dehydrogenase